MFTDPGRKPGNSGQGRTARLSPGCKPGRTDPGRKPGDHGQWVFSTLEPGSDYRRWVRKYAGIHPGLAPGHTRLPYWRAAAVAAPRNRRPKNSMAPCTAAGQDAAVRRTCTWAG